MFSFRQLLTRGQTLHGLALCYPCPGIVERIGKEWDWIWIDAQHGHFDLSDMLSAVRATECVGGRAIIRPPGKSSEWLGMAADLAPAGVMVPMVNSGDEAREVVKGLRFPPLGCRSFGSRRAGDMHGPGYYRDLDLYVMAQIETVEAIAHAAAIIETDGIDCLFFGANDVKLAMGLPQDLPLAEAPEVMEAMAHTADVARAAGKTAGCVAVGESAIRVAQEMGYKVIASGADQIFLREGSANALRVARSIKPVEVATRSGSNGAGAHAASTLGAGARRPALRPVQP